MTMLPFKQDLYNDNYKVMAGTGDWEYNLFKYDGIGIKMELTRDETSRHRPYGQSLESLADLATTEKAGVDKDFYARYQEIFCGQHPEWRLVAFDVSFGEITLWYSCIPGDVSFLTITNPYRLHLTFTTPRSRLGFDSTYETIINSDDTNVIEDLGYIRYDRYIKLKDPNKGNCKGNLYMEGEVHTGI